ncbi:hypothetical protein DSO57_1017370 [Entomophthora muscae]|uniref:Uncharacterized protein n=1 Tax=Entomophthora muscae TaxID=34485 RepID=A0ACC2T4U3_9FUNG|nr:hypothetical protein DSO57_1017370 [Entomophthora muscae]
MQAQYKLLASQHPPLVNDDSSKPVPGYDLGQTLRTGDQEPHKSPARGSFTRSVGGVLGNTDREMLKYDQMASFNGKKGEAENFLREFKNRSKLMLWSEKLK